MPKFTNLKGCDTRREKTGEAKIFPELRRWGQSLSWGRRERVAEINRTELEEEGTVE